MAVRCVSWLAIGVVCGLTLGRLADGQEAPAKGDQPADVAAPAKGAAAERPPFFEFPKEKVVEIEKDCNKFIEGEPTKDDFARLEEHYALLKTATAPAIDGEVWLEWFYGMLESPTKEDSDSWKLHYEKLDRWRAAFPQSPVPLTAAARAHVKHGWSERGTGLARTVTEAQWLLFHDHLERAKELLDQARELPSHDAAVYEELIKIGMATGADRDTIDGYVAAARKIDPRHYDVYEAMAFYLMPRWQGEPGDIGRFAEQMWQESPPEEAPEVYARISAIVQPSEPLLMISGDFDLEKLRAGAKLLQSRYRKSTYYQNYAALVAVRTADAELARATREHLEKNRDRRFLSDRGYELFVKLCNVETPAPKGQRIVWLLRGLPMSIAFSPSGNSLVVGSQVPIGADPVTVYSVKDLSIMQELSGGFQATALAIDSKGTRVAAAFSPNPLTQQSGTFAIFKVGDWNDPLTIEHSGQQPEGIGFSPDGTRLLGPIPGKGIGIWNVEDGKLEKTIPLESHFRSIRYTPDGKRLIATHEAFAEIFDADSGQRLHKLPLDPARDGSQICTVIGCLPDGWLLASGYDKSRSGTALFAWNPDSRRRRDLFKVSGVQLSASPKMSLLAVERAERNKENNGQEAFVEIWGLKERRRLATIGGLTSMPAGLAFSADERTLAAACQDGSVRLWDLSEYLPAEQLAERP